MPLITLTVHGTTFATEHKKLWPECVPDRDLDGFETDFGSARHSQDIVDDITIIDDIVAMVQSMGLEVDVEGIEELLEDHSIELTTDVLERLQNEQNWLIELKEKKMSQVF